jgi:hypothetical protein
MSPSFDRARYLFVLNLKLDSPADALPYLDYAIQNDSSGVNLGSIRQFAREMVQLQRMAEKDSANNPF